MDKEASNKEIEEIEDITKNLLKDVSDLKLEEEINNVENTVERVLTELSDLGEKLPQFASNLTNKTISIDQNYLMAVRRLQNAMKLYLIDGTNKKDLNLYKQGFEFFKNAESMILATRNQAELDQIRNEFAQSLFKVLMITKNRKNDNDYTPFILMACKGLAEINENLKQYDIALTFHSRAGYLLSNQNPLLAELEYFQAILDHILISDNQKAEKILVKLNIKHIRNMAEEVINSKDEKSIDEITNKLEVLGVQRRLDVKNAIILLNKIKEQFKRKETEKSGAEMIEAPTKAIPLSDKMIQDIQLSLSKGIQQINNAYPNIQVSAQIDTKSIVSELKQAISSEISKEIKSLSNDIITNILKNIPSGIDLSSARPRSGGQISDDIPEIKIVEGAPREKAERPKLDDMLDSIIVCE
ncbi:MAG: hypothetical protein ACTSQO_05215 [Candidatus Helarchaeota archaeon]